MSRAGHNSIGYMPTQPVSGCHCWSGVVVKGGLNGQNGLLATTALLSSVRCGEPDPRPASATGWPVGKRGASR